MTVQVAEWKDVTIADFGEVIGGGTPSRATPSFWNGSIPWITPGEMKGLDDKYVLNTRERITEAGLAASAARLLPVGALLVTTRATLGEVAIAGVPVATNQGFKSIIPNEQTSSLFAYYRISSLRAEMERLASGTTFLEISKSDFCRIRTRRPLPDEQYCIASILNTVDAAIEKTEVVIAKLKKVRAGLLQDLLTRGLDEYGRIRDPVAHPDQFQESPLGHIPRAWQVRTFVRTMAAIFDYRGRTPLKLSMEWGSGDIPALSANNVEMGRINFEKETNRGSLALYKRWMTQGDVEEGDVLMTMEAPLGNVAQIPDRELYILSQRVVVFRPKPPLLDKDFLALQMMGARFQRELVRLSTGSTAVGIQRAKLETIDLVVPTNLAEQQRIAKAVRSVDETIAGATKELEKYKFLKSGLMADLLTGRVRVPEHLIPVAVEAA